MPPCRLEPHTLRLFHLQRDTGLAAGNYRVSPSPRFLRALALSRNYLKLRLSHEVADSGHEFYLTKFASRTDPCAVRPRKERLFTSWRWLDDFVGQVVPAVYPSIRPPFEMISAPVRWQSVRSKDIRAYERVWWYQVGATLICNFLTMRTNC